MVRFMINSIKIKAKKLKMQIFVLYKVLGYDECGMLPKILIWVTLGLFLSPIDLIPDFIPILGYLDDLILIPMLIVWILKLIPDEAINRAEKEVLEGERIDEKAAGIVAALLIISIWIGVAIAVYLKIKG